MKRKFLSTLLFLTPAALVFGQMTMERSMSPEFKFPKSIQAKSAFDPDRMVYGGNVGAWFGSDYSLVQLAPMAGYKLTDDFVAGLGVSYFYYSQRFSNGYVLKNHMYGGSAFARYYISQVFAHAEYELLNRKYYDFWLDTDRRLWWGTPMVGLGYTMGGQGVVGFMSMMYAFNTDDPRSPYYLNPLVVRIGFIMR